MPPAPFNHAVEYTVIGAYLVLMIVIGVIFRRFNRNVSDYFRGGSQATWWLVGMSAFMSGISAVTFTGYGGQAFRSGWSVASVYLGNVFGLLIQAFFLAPWFRQMRVTTFPEVIRARFGPGTQQFYAYVKMVTFTFSAGLWLFGLALFTSSMFSLPINLVIPVLGAVSLLYPLIGGKWAVMAADFVQGLVMIGVTVLLTVLCLIRTGGIGGFFDLIAAQHLNAEFAFAKPFDALPDGMYSWPWIGAVFMISVVANCGASNAVKFFAVKDGRAARQAAALSAGLMLAGVVFWFIPPMTARLLFAPEVLASGLVKPEEASIAIISLRLLPAGLIGMMGVAMLSATMSTMDVGINGNAAIMVKDVLPPLFRLLRRPLPTEAVLLAIGRLSTLGFGLAITGLALAFAHQSAAGIFDLMINLGAVIGLPITIPTVLCLFVRRVPAWSAIASIVAALVPPVLALLQPDHWTFYERTLGSLFAGTAAFLLSRLFWRTAPEDYRRQVDAFFEQMHRPVDFAREVGTGSDGRQLTMLGRLSLTTAVFVLLLLFVPNPLGGRIGILCLAVGIGAIGLLLLRSAARARQLRPISPLVDLPVVALPRKN